jgi:signal transduction histidine kinase/CheY-like chemotaxis protein
MFKGIQTKIAGIFAIVIALSAIAGVLIFQSINKLENVVDAVSKPNQHLNIMEQVMSELSQSESDLRAYSLSGNDQYLESYYRFLFQAGPQMDSLRKLSGTNAVRLLDLQLLDSLVNEKLDLLFKVLNLNTSAQKKVSLAYIAWQLREEDSLSHRPAVTYSSPHPQSFLKKLNNLLKRVEYTSTGKNQASRFESLARRADSVNNSQAALFNQLETPLLERDAEIMKGIRALVQKIENEERWDDRQNLASARFDVWHATRVIFIISLVGICILLILTYLIFSDLTRSNKYKKELEQSKKKAEELAKVKEDFLANMSHEIRTPLNAIVGFTELMLNSQLEKQQKKYLEGIHKSSEHLLNVVNDILDFSKIEAGKLQLEYLPFQTQDLIADVVGTMKFAATAKNLTLSYKVSQELTGLSLLSDSFRIKQILLNLVSNAVKFTEHGKVEIRCSSSFIENGRLTLKFEVSDTGIGIPSENLGHIFDEFRQADTSITRKYGGSGLGLAICKKLATLLHGTIVAHSTPGKGSVFTFTVQCERDDVRKEQKTVPKTIPGKSLVLANKHMLIADDDELNRLLLRTLLSAHKIKVDEADDGSKALQMAQAGHYDMILTDVHMPELSGLSLVKEIRSSSDPELSSTPVIALTANVVKEDQSKYKEAGMSDCLIKPYKEQALLELIAKNLHLDPVIIAPRSTEEKGSSVRPLEKNKYSLDELRRVSNGNEQFVARMIRSFIDNTRNNLVLLREEAEHDNWDRVGSILHRMSPSCHKLKLFELYNLLLESERLIREKEYTSLSGLMNKLDKLVSPELSALEKEYEKITAEM